MCLVLWVTKMQISAIRIEKIRQIADKNYTSLFSIEIPENPQQFMVMYDGGWAYQVKTFATPKQAEDFVRKAVAEAYDVMFVYDLDTMERYHVKKEVRLVKI